MSGEINPAAVAHLPSFITAPGDTDGLMRTVTILLIVSVIAVGLVVLTLHTLPERRLHGTKKVQLELVSVLCLLALLTHEHFFWVIGLVLAFVEVPDFSTPLLRMARAQDRLAKAHGAPEDVEPVPVVATPDVVLPVKEH